MSIDVCCTQLFLPLLSSHDATAATATAAVDPTHHTVIGTKHSRLLYIESVCAVCNAFKLDMQKFQHMATCEVCVCVYMCKKKRRKSLLTVLLPCRIGASSQHSENIFVFLNCGTAST